MSLKKIVVLKFGEDGYVAIGYDKNGIKFSDQGLTANAAIGALIFSYGIKFGIEIKTEDHQGRVLGSKKKGR